MACCCVIEAYFSQYVTSSAGEAHGLACLQESISPAEGCPFMQVTPTSRTMPGMRG